MNKNPKIEKFTRVIMLVMSPLLSLDVKASTLEGQLVAAVYKMPEEVRVAILNDDGKLARYIESTAKYVDIYNYAQKLNIKEDPMVKLLVRAETERIIVEEFLRAEYKKLEDGMPDFSALARQNYEVNRQKYAKPEIIQVAHILVRVESPVNSDSLAVAERKIQEAEARLNSGEAFDSVAKELSDDSVSAKAGGQLPGWYSKGQLVTQFEDVAFALKVGDKSGIVQTKFGFHIIKLMNRRQQEVQSFDLVQAELVAELKKKELHRRKVEFMDRFSANVDAVEVDKIIVRLRERFAIAK